MEQERVLLNGVTLDWCRREGSFSMTQHHFHDYFELYYLYEGQRQYFIDTATYHVPQKAAVLISPGFIHKTAPVGNEPHERLLLEIQPGRLERLASALPEGFRLHLARTPVLVVPFESNAARRADDAARQIIAEMRRREKGCEELICLYIQELMLHTLRQSLGGASAPVVNGQRHKRIYEVSGYISASQGNIGGLEELCRRFYYSKSRLCHEFKSVTGMTVQEYITATRVRSAQRILRTSGLPITEVAFRVGYGSITHFERMFKRVTGHSPLQYRKQHSRDT